MKKYVALLLSSAMVLSTVAGLAACGKKKPNPGPGPDPGPDPGPGPVVVDDEVKKGKSDPRVADQYSVYGKDGTKVSDHSNLVDAIRAAVDNDVDEFEAKETAYNTIGSYVLMKGSTHKVFQNRKGFGENAGDVYYYYDENGGLLGYEPWSTGVPFTRILNQKWTTYQVSKGVETAQAVNGYATKDGLGQDLAKSPLQDGGRAWEHNPSMDASIKCIPVRDSGATGGRYTLDLSETKITPPYDGVEDKVYAFLGFYIGAGKYTNEIGIACDTATGVWYEYIGHAPSSNAIVENEYYLGDKLMTSTWDETGGYFTPDKDTLTFEIKEVSDEDEDGDKYFYDSLTVTSGTETLLNVKIDDEFINKDNSGQSFDPTNGFFFSVGLDVVEKDAKLKDTIGATDYTNGAKFENIVFENSEIYFPAADEMTNVEYKKPIQDAYRGKWWSTKVGYEDITKGIYNYTLFQNQTYIDYSLDEHETFSFSYEAYTPADLSGELKTVQTRIDALSAITAETASEYTDELDEVGKLYGNGDAAASSLAGYVYNAVDFAPYLAAQKVYEDNVSISEEGQAIVDALKTLTNLDVNTWKGYKAPAEAPSKTGYLYSEAVEVFGELYAKFNQLPTADQRGVTDLGGSTWTRWVALYEQLTEIEFGTFGSKMFTVPKLDMSGLETLSGRELVATLFDTAASMRFPCAMNNPEHTDEENRLLFAGTVEGANKTFRVLNIRDILNENDVELDYLEVLINLMAASDSENQYNGAGMLNDWENYIKPVFTQVARIENGECTYLDAELAAVVNATKNFDFKEPNFNWNIDQKNGSMVSSGEANWGIYFGFSFNGRTFQKVIEETVLKIVKAAKADVKIADNGVAVAEDVTALDKAPGTLSTEATEVVTAFKALKLTDLYDVTAWKGFSTDGGQTAGYLYDELGMFNAVYAQYAELEGDQQTLVREALADTVFGDWLKLYTDWMAVATDETQVDIWKSDFSATEQVSRSEIFFRYVNHMFWKNTDSSNCQDGKGKAGQGYLCVEHQDCWKNSMYALYLEKALAQYNVAIDYIIDIHDMIAHTGSSNPELTGLDAGEGLMIDFDYMWYMGKQIGRILRGECTYLDAELAYYVNHYMVANHENSTTKYGTNQCFYNGTFAWAYYTGTIGYIKSFNANWMNCIDANLSTLTKGNNWAAAIKKVNDLLKSAGYETLLLAPVNKNGEPMLVKTTVHAVPAPAIVDDLADEEADVANFVRQFRALGDLNDLTVWAGWTVAHEGLKTMETELNAFRLLNTKIAELDATKQARVKELAGEDFAQWVKLSEQYAVVEANEEKVHVKMFDTTTGGSMSSFEVNYKSVFGGFINQVCMHNFMEGCTSEGTMFLCFEHNNCYHNSARAYYLYQYAHELNIEVDYMEKVVELIRAGGGNSEYTGLTNGEGTWRDLVYLDKVGEQIVRIINNECTFLDAELAEVINTYMLAKGTGDKAETGYGTYESFYNGTFSYAYRQSGKLDLNGFNNEWLYYLHADLVQKNEQDKTMSWSELMAKYLNPIIIRDAGADYLLNTRDHGANFTPAPMLVSKTVTAVTAPKQGA